jgi:hypothetical protein
VWRRANTFTCGFDHLSFPCVAAARGIPDFGLSLGAQISPLGIDRLNQGDFRSARHLLDLALAANSLVDIVEFFEVDQPVDVIASRE